MNRQSHKMPLISQRLLIRHFKKFLPQQAIIAQPETLRAYECDGLSAYQQLPRLVLLPDTVKQVQQIMRVCNELQIPVVSRGAGTSLSGGALPHANGIVLSLAKMNQLLAIDAHNCTARVQPGIRNLAVSEAVKHLGLFYAPDPSSQIVCTIGGNVAENAGGVHCLKYGLTIHNIVSLKMVASDGTLLSLGNGSLDYPGFDLLALLVGSEGMLGVVVEVTLKLLPCPETAAVLLGVFDSVEKSANSVAAMIASGIIPAGIEMMDNPAIRAAEDFTKAGYPKEAAAILLCELDGTPQEVDAQVSEVRRLLVQYGAVEIRVAHEQQERALLWSGRKNAFPAIGRIAPDYYCIDGTIPRKFVGSVLTEINRLSGEYGLPVANVFHAGDGNLHPLILYDANQSGELQKAEELGGKILRLCVAVGGTITGEHGVGVEKIGEMCAQFTDRELAQFHAVRAAFDPKRLLNPDKAIPTLARCAEYNAMHVHQGETRFPEIPRF